MSRTLHPQRVGGEWFGGEQFGGESVLKESGLEERILNESVLELWREFWSVFWRVSGTVSSTRMYWRGIDRKSDWITLKGSRLQLFTGGFHNIFICYVVSLSFISIHVSKDSARSKRKQY